LRENFTNMLIRFVVDNVFSFGEQREFNMLPNTKLKTLQYHKYNFTNFEVLKLSAIYGANGAGKSNLISALRLLQLVVTMENIPTKLKNSRFKFQKNIKSSKQTLGIEFIQDSTSFLYGIELDNNTILTEELYESGLGLREDKLIYERKTKKGITKVTFSEEFEKDEKSKILKEVLLQEFIKPNKPILKLISHRDNKYLSLAKKAYEWFSETLTIITPDSKAAALAHLLDVDENLQNYAQDIMCSFSIGITGLSSKKDRLEDLIRKDSEIEFDKLIKKLEESPNQMIGLRKNGEEIIIVKEDNDVFVKKLQLNHIGKGNVIAKFDINEESDGTIRLLDFIPAFKGLVNQNQVFVIDEIERSLHPILIKELIKKFADDENTKGQLIFTTHESNLLDQNIFRQDEIWFAEKDKNGCTDIYSLSDFKEHKTIDIQKGYLNGRYGSIPFLGNLQDLNWHKYDTIEK
jgi:AAA15 family ATPase/GTPase